MKARSNVVCTQISRKALSGRLMLFFCALLCAMPAQANKQKHLKRARIILSTMCLISVASKFYKMVYLIKELGQDEHADAAQVENQEEVQPVDDEVAEQPVDDVGGQEEGITWRHRLAGLKKYQAIAQCIQKILYYGDLAIIGFLLAID
jgi:hypothetical protein